MQDFPINYESASHWGMFPHDEMALERATWELFEWGMGQSPVKRGKTYREYAAKMRRCIAAYEGTLTADKTLPAPVGLFKVNRAYRTDTLPQEVIEGVRA